MKSIRFVLMLALGALTAGVLAEEDFTRIYWGPNIGIVTHPRKVFENLDLSQYELRSAANGTYYSDYTIINGAGRTIYLPLSQARSTVDGKSGWFGESGACCVSSATPQRNERCSPPFAFWL